MHRELGVFFSLRAPEGSKGPEEGLGLGGSKGLLQMLTFDPWGKGK